MPSSAPLLCELHSHTTFSDGSLTPTELVDLYGTAGFDVLAITDRPPARPGRRLARGAPLPVRALPRGGRAGGGARAARVRDARHPRPRAHLRERRPDRTFEATSSAPRTTARFATEREWAAAAVDRFELCNRHDFFPWVAEERLPVVANGDFHRPEHLATWKTLLPCAREEGAVLDYLRSPLPVSLVRVDEPAAGARRARAA